MASSAARPGAVERFAAKINGFDGDLEVMVQTGSIGSDSIRAGAIGSLSGYTSAGIGWTPRLGFQFDAASGDSNPHDNVLQTFNPLFPNGHYFSLAGYTGYTNLIHVKPSITIHPTDSLTLTVAVAAQWRETTADAVYTQGNVPVPGTAGQAGRYTGTYGQLRLDWAINSHSSFAVEAVRFDVGNTIQRAGGHNSDYLGFKSPTLGESLLIKTIQSDRDKTIVSYQIDQLTHAGLPE
jgi:hypothetical protein